MRVAPALVLLGLSLAMLAGCGDAAGGGGGDGGRDAPPRDAAPSDAPQDLAAERADVALEDLRIDRPMTDGGPEGGTGDGGDGGGQCAVEATCNAAPTASTCVPDDGGAPDGAARVPCFTAEVLPILTRNCALTNCHSGAGDIPAQYGSLEPDVAYATLVCARSRIATGLNRVEPGDVARSMLAHKLDGDFRNLCCVQGACGSKMPLRCPQERPCLLPTEVQLVKDWIAGGAPNN